MVVSDLGYSINPDAPAEIGDYRVYPDEITVSGSAYFRVKDKVGNPIKVYQPDTIQLVDRIFIDRGKTKPFTFPQPPVRQPAKGFSVKLLNAVNAAINISVANVVVAPL